MYVVAPFFDNVVRSHKDCADTVKKMHRGMSLFGCDVFNVLDKSEKLRENPKHEAYEGKDFLKKSFKKALDKIKKIEENQNTHEEKYMGYKVIKFSRFMDMFLQVCEKQYSKMNSVNEIQMHEFFNHMEISIISRSCFEKSSLVYDGEIHIRRGLIKILRLDLGKESSIQRMNGILVSREHLDPIMYGSSHGLDPTMYEEECLQRMNSREVAGSHVGIRFEVVLLSHSDKYHLDLQPAFFGRSYLDLFYRMCFFDSSGNHINRFDYDIFQESEKKNSSNYIKKLNIDTQKRNYHKDKKITNLFYPGYF